MKKNILFVCSSMKMGGAEKSLVNLLNMIDYDKYSVSLLLLQNRGVLKQQIPSKVNILDLPQKAKSLYDEDQRSFINILMKIIKYVSTGLEFFLWRDYDAVRAHRWVDFYCRFCEKLPYCFDAVIAFQSGESTYFSFDKIIAKRYVTYFHTDIKNIKLASKIDDKYLKLADLIVTISPQCVDSIVSLFPNYKMKTVCLNNPVSYSLIHKLAGDVLPIEYEKFCGYIKIISVGRLVDIKGFDLVIDAATILKNKKIMFKWFIVGEGKERKKLEKQILQNKVSDCVFLIGQRTNPYPYIKFANLLVQSSRYEGKSVVLDEAKILEKPIVVTNYNSVKDQIIDGVSGYICEMNPDSIAKGVMKSIEKPIIAQAINKTDDVSDYMNVILGEVNL